MNNNNFFPGASEFMITGGTFNAISTTNISQSKRGIDILMEFIAIDALHNSADQHDAPKCHPRTRIAVLDDIMKWVIESEAQEEFMMWLFGPAGAGKSAIARKIAELAAEKGLLIGTFFFSRTSPTRSTKDRLIATLAYQLAVSVPGIRTHIENAIERDPAIFKKSLHAQIDTLLIKPFQSVSAHTVPFPKLIIIDGLDECVDIQGQMAILDAISCSIAAHKLPLTWFVASRPEIDLVTSFNGNEPLKSIHRRLALDDNYHPDHDIRLFFSDKFEAIRCTHRLRSTIPIPWPSNESLDTLVNKSSGQFIFAATVVRFIQSSRHRPAARLNIILGISPPGTINPFAELDVLYRQILSSVDDIQLMLRVLSLYTSLPGLASSLDKVSTIEQFLSLEEGDIDRALIELPSIISYDESSGKVKIIHASFVDFLSDQHRSNEFYIDMANARADFACRTLQYVKGPDGILAGDFDIVEKGIMGSWTLTDQLKNELLNFDLDAFIMAAIKSSYSRRTNIILRIFYTWMHLIPKMALEDGDKELLIGRCANAFESRLQIYQLDRRLQLLLTLVIAMALPPENIMTANVSRPRHLDILLEMDDPDLHLVDQEALGLCYSNGFFIIHCDQLRDITFRYVDGDRWAAAALHCMRFLSNSQKYSDSNGSLETGITYVEWKETAEVTLDFLCSFLHRADTSPEVIQYMSNHDINATVQKHCPVTEIWRVDTYILAFLVRGGACVNWRILSAIRRGLSPTNMSAAARSPRFGEQFKVWW